MKTLIKKNEILKNIFRIFFISFLFLNQNFAQEWKDIKMGAGGWMTGMSIHPSGSPVYSRSDQNGVYRWNENTNTWKQLITATSMPVEEIDAHKHFGVLSVASAPADKNVVYMAYNASIFKSSNQGDTWQNTNFPLRGRKYMNPNVHKSKLAGERLAVDPINNNVVYFGSFNEGLFSTMNGGATWEIIASVPKGTEDQGVRAVVFDPTSGDTNGKTNVIYVMIDGGGVYKSVNAGTSWTNITSGSGFNIDSARFIDMEIAKNGDLYVSAYGFGCKRYDRTSWKDVSPNNEKNISQIALDPFNINRVILKGQGNKPFYRTNNINDAAPTWTSMTWETGQTDIPWFDFANTADWTSEGEYLFDPAVQGRLWLSGGIGTWRTSNLDDSVVTLEGLSNGQEHMVNNDLIALENGTVVIALWDRPIFVKKPGDFDQYADRYYPSNRFNSAWDIDVSPSNSNFIAAIIEDHRFCCYDEEHRNSGYSMDGGETWTRFETFPENDNENGIYGNIAVSATDIDNMVWLPTNNKPAYYTKNRGRTWTEVNMPDKSGECCIHANYIEKKVLVADRVAPNTFYIYDWGGGIIHKSTDGGVNWAAQGNVPGGAWNAKLLAVNDKAGHLLYIHGHNGTTPETVHGVYHSTDGGLTWNEMANTDGVNNVAVGKAAPNSDYPTIFIQGEVNGDFGYHMSTNQGVSWTKFATYPNNNYDRARVLEGDAYKFGRVYLGPGSDGILYFDADGVSCPAAGTSCDDGNPNTTNDVEDGNCNCSGETDCPAAGTPCDDGNPNTINDVEDGNCGCSGVITDEVICNVDTELTIDGSDADWSEESALISNVLNGSVNSTEDLSANFQVQWDADYLYLLIDVKDDILISDSENSYDDDSVEIFIDGENNKGTTYGENDHQLVFGYGTDTVIHYPANQSNPDGVFFAQQDTDSGYRIEVKIAWSFIGVTPSLNNTIGIEVGINDDDTGGNRDKKIGWNATEDLAWKDPSVFGSMLIGDCNIEPSLPTTDEVICSVIRELTIDGSDADWPENARKVSNVLLGSVNSTEDLSANFQTQWDADYLYVLIDVTDDILINDSENSYQDDSVEIFIDGGNNKGTTYDENDHQLVFGYGTDIVNHYPANQSNPDGVFFTQQDTDSGYRIEVKIAWSFIGVTPSLDNAIGIDIGINDDDTGGNRDKKIGWNATEDVAWKDSSVFGSMLIGDCNSLKALNDVEIFIKVFPNPAKDRLYVTFPANAKATSNNYTLKIFDVSGKVLGTYPVSEGDNVINIERLSSAFYFITISGNEKPFATKFLKN